MVCGQEIRHIGGIAGKGFNRQEGLDMDILYLVLVLLVVTRVFAELAERTGLPAIVGELVAGVALGLILRRS